ncbi:translation elongation factor Ts [Halocola ammonii]
MKITASEVNKLRQQTGAGMMDCKKALQEANGDFDAAVDILRKKGQKVAAKREDRDAAEGLVLADVTSDNKKGALIVLNCETDFVAKNEEFGKVARSILNTALNESPSDLESLKALKYDGGDFTISEKITEEIGKIGEKIDLSHYGKIEAEKVVAYNHPGNSLGSMVGFSKDIDDDTARDIAMQVAAMAPVSITEDSVPQDVIDRELQVGKDQAIEEGKPEDLAEKIAQGRLKKFFKESTLLNQAFIKDNKKSISQVLKEAGDGVTVTKFVREALG